MSTFREELKGLSQREKQLNQSIKVLENQKSDRDKRNKEARDEVDRYNSLMRKKTYAPNQMDMQRKVTQV